MQLQKINMKGKVREPGCVTEPLAYALNYRLNAKGFKALVTRSRSRSDSKRRSGCLSVY